VIMCLKVTLVIPGILLQAITLVRLRQERAPVDRPISVYGRMGLWVCRFQVDQQLIVIRSLKDELDGVCHQQVSGSDAVSSY